MTIRKVSEPHGILGNMSPHPVRYGGEVWPTAEALFQAMRFAEDDPIRTTLRGEKNPMKAKFMAKGRASRMVIEQLGPADRQNMRKVLALKLAQHRDVRECLESTGDRRIVEDCTKRPRGSGLFWGAARCASGTWRGQNVLGELWMDLRGRLKMLSPLCACPLT